MEGISQTKTFNKIGSVLSDKVKILIRGGVGGRKLRPRIEEVVSFRIRDPLFIIGDLMIIFCKCVKTFQLIKTVEDNNRKCE